MRTPEEVDASSTGEAAVEDRAPLEGIFGRLEELLEAVDMLADADRENVVELLDRVDDLHRLALSHLGAALPAHEIESLRAAHPAVAWLFEAYGVGLDEPAAVDAALDRVRPYLHAHDVEVELIGVADGTVHVRLSGPGSDGSASAMTLRDEVEAVLRAGVVGFVRLRVDGDSTAAVHAPAGPTLLQIAWHPEAAAAPGR